jgi:hypothetical protein
MVRRPDSIPEARRAMRDSLHELNATGQQTECQKKPVLYADRRGITPEEAAELCGRGTDDECPLLALCEPLGFTESVYADEMVYGGLVWRRGIPVDPSSKPMKGTTR